MTRIKKSPLLRYLGIIAVGVLISLAMLGHFEWESAVVNILCTLVYWEGAWWITTYSRKRFEHFEETKKRMLFQVLSIVAYVAITNYGLCHLVAILFENKARFSWQIYGNTLKMSLFITLLITAIYEAENFFLLWKKAIVDTERQKQETLKAQFETLKNQVNPHFLFNSLNTLAAIIPENPDHAVEFVQKLSNLYRYILQYRDQPTVTLQTELESIEAYLYLQHIRFGNSLSWEIRIPETAKNAQIPPLSLQMLAENAVKHNTISRLHPLKIEVFMEDDRLVLRNNLQPKRSKEPSTHLGLSNLSERLALVSGRKLEVLRDDAYFTVILPLTL